MLNKVTLIGNLGRDPEVRQLESGVKVAKFSVATNENYRDKTGEWQTITEWHDIVCWRGLAERAEREWKKGNLVYVEGKITKRKWQDRDGNDRYTTEIVANSIKLLDRRDSQSRSSGSFPGAADEYPTTSFSQTNQPETNAAQDFSNVEEDDDLPF